MIQRHTFDFLKELVENNNREWFQANKERYDAARENVIDFAAKLIRLMQKIDPNIDTELDPKKCVMRIYRDIRFSKNKTPYKNNFGVSIPTKGHKLGGAEYYLQISPEKSFIAGGYWMPEAAHLKAIRQEIDYNSHDLKKIIDDPEFIKLFGEFRKQEQLKSVPRDYDAGNENIELLKLKSFVAFHYLENNELSKNNADEIIADVCRKIYPLNVFLNNAIA
ncbi:DUF2461 domain-containing protein [Mucilaginibacter sp. BJC16-A38]|uniref:DUF2461 domain-containing protein n=1 Tax=Mucilaginibacter phenanthrenivorans TaxID=1234842 RepID=UPI0021581D43|nr:DUF2461 domain-containing protein [Mucilaginibacter phenanthrenivorans]MCR8558708.1 DUF2461 domain-containing protein [Mucilaginibacter phenanthrenivorans]